MYTIFNITLRLWFLIIIINMYGAILNTYISGISSLNPHNRYNQICEVLENIVSNETTEFLRHPFSASQHFNSASPIRVSLTSLFRKILTKCMPTENTFINNEYTHSESGDLSNVGESSFLLIQQKSSYTAVVSMYNENRLN